MQNITIIGWLTRDPEVRRTSKGEEFTYLNVRAKQKDGTYAYYSVSCYSALGVACARYLKAERQVAVNGELTVSQTNGKCYHNISVKNLEFLPSGKSTDTAPAYPASADPAPGETRPDMTATPLDGFTDIQTEVPW